VIIRNLKTLEVGVHPKDVDEVFHVLDIVNIIHVVYWARFFEMVKDVSGTIVECGVGRGRSLLIHTALNRIIAGNTGRYRQTYAFDSFEGFPEPHPEDDSFRKPRKGEWSHSPSGKYQYNSDFISNVLFNAGIKNFDKYVTLIKGFFSETVTNYEGGPIAILHLDGDLYESYRDPLNILYDQVAPGGVIVFDDFTTEKNGEDRFPGGRKAAEDFFADKPEGFQNSIRGTPYIIKI
jgi:hypothetical protein